MMCSAYRLNKQGDSRQLCHTLFFNPEPISCSIQGSNCCFSTCIQVSQKTGKLVWYSHLSKSFPQFMIHTVIGFESESEVAQSCLTLCDPMDCSPPGSSVHGILQARILEWVAISFSRGIFPIQGSNPGLPHCRQTL